MFVRCLILIGLSAALTACAPAVDESSPGTSFDISFTSEVSADALDGRLILILSKDDEREPRFQVRPGVDAVQIFGMNVDGMAPEQDMRLDESVFGYPHDSLAELPAGDYFVQALLHKYSTFNLANGKTVKLPMDEGEGQSVVDRSKLGRGPSRGSGFFRDLGRPLHIQPFSGRRRLVARRHQSHQYPGRKR